MVASRKSPLRRALLIAGLMAVLTLPLAAGRGAGGRQWMPASRRIKDLVSRDASRLNALDDRGFTPLFESVRQGHLIVADMLIGAGARLDLTAPFGWTCLHEAVKRGDRPMADMLLLRGADPNARDHWGKTPMHVAYENGDAGMIRLLAEYHAEDPAYRVAPADTVGLGR